MKITEKTPTKFQIVMGSSPTIRVLDFLIENSRTSWTITEIRDHAHVGYSSLEVVIPHLIEIGILKVAKEKGKSQYITINMENTIMKKIKGLYQKILMEDINAP